MPARCGFAYRSVSLRNQQIELRHSPFRSTPTTSPTPSAKGEEKFHKRHPGAEEDLVRCDKNMAQFLSKKLLKLFPV
jgi:hypothetical protein